MSVEAFYAACSARRFDAVRKVFDARTQLRVTRVEVVAAAPYTVLGWRVDDLEAAMAGCGPPSSSALRGAGAGRGAWTAPGGSRIAWFADPDGNTLSLQQAP